MAKEIERKFLVNGDSWRTGVSGTRYRQGYLSSVPERTVRVRTEGIHGTLTIKGLTEGATRDEFEYEIPLADAKHLIDLLCERPILQKTRYKVDYGGLTWEIDEFGGENQGLILAEVELASEDQSLPLPPWAGNEVTGDPRYYNSNLARRPFRSW